MQKTSIPSGLCTEFPLAGRAATALPPRKDAAGLRAPQAGIFSKQHNGNRPCTIVTLDQSENVPCIRWYTEGILIANSLRSLS